MVSVALYWPFVMLRSVCRPSTLAFPMFVLSRKALRDGQRVVRSYAACGVEGLQIRYRKDNHGMSLKSSLRRSFLSYGVSARFRYIAKCRTASMRCDRVNDQSCDRKYKQPNACIKTYFSCALLRAESSIRVREVCERVYDFLMYAMTIELALQARTVALEMLLVVDCGRHLML